MTRAFAMSLPPLRRAVLLLALLGLAVTAGCDSGSGGGETRASGDVRPGVAPPSLAVHMVSDPEDVGGALDAYRGKVVVLGFWLGGCAPCLTEMPELVDLRKTYGPQGVEVLLVNVGGNEQVVQDLARKFNVSFPMALDTLSLTASRYGVAVFPTNFIIGRDGKVQARIAGERRPGHLTKQVAKLL